MSCTCGSKSFLHAAACESIQTRNKSVYGEMIVAANGEKSQIIFYIGSDIDSKFDEFMRQVGPNFMYAVGNTRAGTVSLGMGSEITFVTEIDAPDLVFLPRSNVIYVEKSQTSDNTIETLKGHTDKVVTVDPLTKEAL